MTGQAETLYSLSGKRVMVAGSRGMVGSALMGRLVSEDCQLLPAGRQQVDMRRQSDVEDWMAEHKPQAVFLAAATVGGILANDSRPAEFIRDNLAIQTNIIHAAWKTKVEKLLFLGSACIYPKHAPQPMSEDTLLTGPLEPTNQWYAIAKIAGIKMCQAYRRQYGCDFISAQPINLYGPGDNFDLTSSHVIPALMIKAHQAKMGGESSLEAWGTGTPMREFLHVDDLAESLVFLMKVYSGEIQINIGSGIEVSIRELVETISEIVGFGGDVVFNTEMPDGTPRKLLDSTRIGKMGWEARIGLKDGLEQTYRWYLENAAGRNIERDA